MEERESFIFYRSFYEAIRELQDNIRLEVFTAITEYALYGKLPGELKPFARAVFTLIKPNLDANIARYSNGKKGGRKANKADKTTADKPKPAAPQPAPHQPGSVSEPELAPRTVTPRPPKPQPTFTSFQEEADTMRADTAWTEPVCMQFHIDQEELSRRLDSFVTHCKIERPQNLHPSLAEARRHFTSWMRKAYAQTKTPTVQPKPSSDYSFNGGFGGEDI